MIVQKFGGTSVEDGAAIERLAGIVKRAGGEGPVVVCAAGTADFNDSNTFSLNRQRYIILDPNS